MSSSKGWCLSFVFRLSVFTVLVSLSPILAAAQGVTFYVSPEGNNSWSGRFGEPRPNAGDGPFATIERARDAVREWRARGLSGPVTVYVRGGLYELARPLVFTPEDSGTATAPVQYVAYHDERPVISGGRRIAGWTRTHDGMWFTQIPEVTNGSWYFDQLFVNGERRQRARTPNTGYYTVAELLDPATKGVWTPIRRVRYRSGELRSTWKNLKDVEMVALFRWMNARLPIEYLDETEKVVGFQKPAHSVYISEARYYIDNLFEGLDSPGEWYLDRTTGSLYYIPMPGEDPASAEIRAPRLSELVLFLGDPGHPVENITLQGLVFTNNMWQLPSNDAGDFQGAYQVPGALIVKRGKSIQVIGCEFRNIGTYAIDIQEGSDTQIVRNFIHDTGAGGIRVTGFDEETWDAVENHSNLIAANTIREIGRRHHDAVGILVLYSANNLISHNEISDLTYSGISVGFSWGYEEDQWSKGTHDNVVEFNHIHHIGNMLNDLGGIYTLGVSPRTFIRNNVIHDIDAYSGFGMGIYLDEGSSGITAENNTVVRTKGPSFFLHYGRDNVARNNIFANAESIEFGVGRDEPHQSVRVEQNIFFWKEAKLLGWNWKGRNLSFDRNTYYQADGSNPIFGDMTFPEWRQTGQDVDSKIADPLLRWKDGIPLVGSSSPATALGFRPIDPTEAGPSGYKAVVARLRASRSGN